MKGPFRDAPQYDTTLRLTLLLVLIHGPVGSFWIPVHLLCALLLVVPGSVRQPYVWWTLAWLAIVDNASNWYHMDNHHYLITYWVLTCALSLGLSDDAERRRFLRGSATTLVALVFLFATFWKVLGGELLDGSFLHFMFLMDARFSQLAVFLTERTSDELSVARAAARYMAASAMLDAPFPLPTSETLRRVTLGLSWTGVLVEGTIAAVHLLPRKRLYTLRLTLLWGFVALTYFLFPVPGFAFILAILGYAQCADEDSNWRLAYIALVGVIYVALLPWARLLFLF